ncbi:DUF2182 domain-containing protein [Roseibium sp. MMSF_3544]|uniref:DUF2182 domain-containing protein n=1 Tax=unclassified Roseibium TaxID=2629323 RepID=UPI00273F2CB0|nr:DUF2182 domain-containing protein [Roseibium sp. MMSF_3544]
MSVVTSNNGSQEQSGLHASGRGWPIVLAFVAILSIGGWTYLVAMIADMVPVMDMTEAGPGMGLFNQFNIFRGLSDEARAALAVICLPAGATFGMPTPDLNGIDLLKVFLMWSMMSMAMMLPTAVPMLKTYFGWIGTEGNGERSVTFAVMACALGYLSIWLGYAVAATLAQWLLSKAGGLSDMMAPATLALTTSVLFAAGLYQFTPAKKSCLQRCWYPRWVFSGERQAGMTSGYREGLIQGLTCLGCCWAVMTVMFAVGLMNIVWIALLGGVMALEKTFPSRVFPAVIGVFLIAWASFLTATIYF